MHGSMAFQSTSGGKIFLTLFALERFFVTVSYGVTRETILTFETFAANVTFIRPDVAIRQAMLAEECFSGKCHFAYFTQVLKY